MTDSRPTTPDPREVDECRHIIQRLGESGQPPVRGVRRINVGTTPILDVLNEAYFRTLLRTGSTFKLVQGYYGGGKTHFLLCVRELAWEHNFACALVELSPHECPYDDAARVYANVVRRIALNPPDGGEPNEGIVQVISGAIDQRMDAEIAAQRAAGSAAPEEDAKTIVRRWLRRTVGTAPCESLALRNAMVAIGIAWMDDRLHTVGDVESWLLGGDVPLSHLREYSVYEKIDRKTGFIMLRSLTQMVRAFGIPGTALLFDEVDRTLSVSAKRTHAIGDNLRQVIDLCGKQQLPSTLFMYAVPPEFMRNVVPDYPALDQRLRSPVRLGVTNPQGVIIDLEDVDVKPTVFLKALGKRILDVYAIAEDFTPDRELQLENIERLATRCAELEFGMQHRRRFVRTIIPMLNQQKFEGEHSLTEDGLQALLHSTRDEAAIPTDEAGTPSNIISLPALRGGDGGFDDF